MEEKRRNNSNDSRMNLNSAKYSSMNCSSSSLSSFTSISASTAVDDVDDLWEPILPAPAKLKKKQCYQTHPEEVNLYTIPQDLSPEFRPLPFVLRCLVWFVAILFSATTSFPPPTALFQEPTPWDAWTCASFVIKVLLFHVVSIALLEEVFGPPARVSTTELMEQHTLPSTLSRYEKLQIKNTIGGTNKTREQGVHYLQYDAPTSAATNNNETTTEQKQGGENPKFEAIYLNHGFGSNSLAWLPLMPRLVDRFKAKVAIGHDATGFGFTDRPYRSEAEERVRQNHVESLLPYTPVGFAEIGNAILEQKLKTTRATDDNSNNNNNNASSSDDKPVLLMGHSMGSLTTLHMAPALPKSTRKWVVLVAPALGINPMGVMTPESLQQHQKKGNSSLWMLFELLVELVSVIGRYVLRRVIGHKDFWRTGLELTWGNRPKLDDNYVMRYQYPAIGKGWEDGILSFVRAMAMPLLISDAKLLENALNDENTIVTVVVATEDRVIRRKPLLRFLEPYRERLRIVEMEGLGHDPLEEDADGLIQVLEDILEKDQDRIFGSS